MAFVSLFSPGMRQRFWRDLLRPLSSKLGKWGVICWSWVTLKLPLACSTAVPFRVGPSHRCFAVSRKGRETLRGNGPSVLKLCRKPFPLWDLTASPGALPRKKGTWPRDPHHSVYSSCLPFTFPFPACGKPYSSQGASK